MPDYTTQFKLSPSSISLMENCQRCFWLEKHGVWKRPESIFPSLPSGMDRILKIHFEKFAKKGMLPPELCENSDCANMKLFDDLELLKIWQNNFKGIKWGDKNGNEIHGAVDNLLIKGKKLIVLDYKTRGYALKEDTTEHYKNQLDIYNFLLRKNGYETEEYSFLLFYIPKEVLETGEVIFDTELKKIKADVKNAEELFEKALKLLNSDCPEEGCVWCEGR